MDRLSAYMVRAALGWLMLGAVIGGLMLIDPVVPGEWVRWGRPTHAHILCVGWFLQFAVGIAYWLLPRRRTPAQPLGYRAAWAVVAVGALNLGLLFRVIAEPVARTGNEAGWIIPMLAACQVAAIIIFVCQLWPRVAPRASRKPAPTS